MQFHRFTTLVHSPRKGRKYVWHLVIRSGCTFVARYRWASDVVVQVTCAISQTMHRAHSVLIVG
jgi:hypothetical protein